eukprot:scaffold4271_cov57-Phaeocystis_antarctica.AAC.4
MAVGKAIVLAQISKRVPRASRLARYTIPPLLNTYLLTYRSPAPPRALRCCDADGGGGERGPAGDQPAARQLEGGLMTLRLGLRAL